MSAAENHADIEPSANEMRPPHAQNADELASPTSTSTSTSTSRDLTTRDRV